MKKYKAWSLILDNLAKVATIASGFSTAVGVLIAAAQYTQSLEEKRVTQVNKYVEIFNKGEFLEARNNIESAWFKTGNEKIIETVKAGNKEWAELMSKVISNNNLSYDLSLLAEFYSIIYICVIGESCELNAAKTAFSQELESFVTYHFVYLCEQHQRRPPKVSNVQNLVKLHLFFKNVDIQYSTYMQEECGKINILTE